jgi:hypothetical protein
MSDFDWGLAPMGTLDFERFGGFGTNLDFIYNAPRPLTYYTQKKIMAPG